MKGKAFIKNIASKCKSVLALCSRHIGLPLVYLGVLLYVVFYFTDLTNYNILLFLPLLLIIAGTIGYIHRAKTKTEY